MSKNRPKKEKYTKCSVCGEYSNYIEFDKPLSDYICDVCKDREDLIAQAKLEAKIEVMEEVVEKFWQKWEGRVVEECTMADYMATFSLMGDMMTMLSNLKKKKK